MNSHAQPDKYRQEISSKEEALHKLREQVVATAYEHLGAKSIRYQGEQQGLNAEAGFDCSGFVCSVLKRAASLVSAHEELGVVPRHANEQWRTFGEAVHYDRRIAGDLVFFASKKISGRYVLGHVGIVVSGEQYIHSPGKDATAVELCELPVRQQELDGVSEQDIYSLNPVGIKRLSLPLGEGRWNVY